MAEMLKITTPVVNKTQVPAGKQVIDPAIPFNLQETGRVIGTNPQSDLLKQNNGMIQKEESPTILMNLLKDPSVTVNFLKNIFMLQEIIKLLPVNNVTMTQEIEQLFNSLLIPPEDIVGEMTRQQDTSTAFKGELFDFLRQIVSQNNQPEIRSGVANLLKSINNILGKKDVLGAIGNSLEFMCESLAPSKGLSERLQMLSNAFFEENAADNFNELKTQVFDLFGEVENSILLSPKLSKVMAITIYNLSRFNSNQDFFQESVSNLLMLIDGKQQKADFVGQVRAFLDHLRNPPEEQEEGSKIMDVLAEILGKRGDDSLTLVNPEKIEKIIHSLLSSPCNFTPLLHFVIPVEYMDIKSFAEFWIDPNGGGDEKEAGGQSQEHIHMLVVFDIEGIGQFEVELYVIDQKIRLTLLCPPAYEHAFSGVASKFEQCVKGYDYKFEDINIGKLERPRSLMEVFKALPYKRTGVDVKI